MKYLILMISLAMGCQQATESVDMLENHFSGSFDWNPELGELRFTESGVFHFPERKDYHEFRWIVPKEVKKIKIATNTQITGFFHVFHDIVIEGENQETSIIYGTSTQNLLRSKRLDSDGGSPPYSAIYGKGNIEIRVKNLTVLNPFSFMFTGKDGAVMHIEGCRGIDNRGGHHNHSDGISADNGSTVKNCYFEAGDDVIKVYHDIYVENTTIKMITNSVPIQLGWGNYGSGAKGVFKNLTIIGDKGRGGTGNAIIDARYGEYNKVLEFEGLTIKNPNASLFNFWNEPKGGRSGGQAKIRMDQVDIEVGQFQKRWNMEVDLEICGEEYRKDFKGKKIQCP